VRFVDGEIVFDTHLEALLRGLAQWGVQEGLSVSPQTPPTMILEVSPGVAKLNQVEFSFDAVTQVSISAADPDYPRKDVVILDHTGAIRAIKGEPAPAEPAGKVGVFTYRPRPPDFPDVATPLAEVWVGAGVTKIEEANITDRRHLIKHHITGADVIGGLLGKAGLLKTFRYEGVTKLVTETEYIIKDYTKATEPFTALMPQRIVFEGSNPPGSGVNLYMRAWIITQETGVWLYHIVTVGEGSVEEQELLPGYIAEPFQDGHRIESVGIGAYVSATPPTGYEPRVRLSVVTGYQY